MLSNIINLHLSTHEARIHIDMLIETMMLCVGTSCCSSQQLKLVTVQASKQTLNR